MRKQYLRSEVIVENVLFVMVLRATITMEKANSDGVITVCRDALIRRFALFLVTALPTFLDATNATLCSSCRQAANTTIVEETALCDAYSLLNMRREVMVGNALLRQLCTQYLATTRSSSAQYFASTKSGHSSSEAVTSFSY